MAKHRQKSGRKLSKFFKMLIKKTLKGYKKFGQNSGARGGELQRIPPENGEFLCRVSFFLPRYIV